MQKITSLSKSILLLALSSSLLIIWNGNNWYSETINTKATTVHSNEIQIIQVQPQPTYAYTPIHFPIYNYNHQISTNKKIIKQAISKRVASKSSASKIVANKSVLHKPMLSPHKINKPEVSISLQKVMKQHSNETSESIWHNMRQQFQLDTRTQSVRVQNEIKKLLTDRNKLYKILKAAVPYIYFIHQQTTMHGLPAEIALIPVIESEFNPNDSSVKGATGLWQLMRVTAHELGLKVREGYDGRRNVVASTKAALAYFKDLGVLFKGNWYLAIAAYNCGQGTVQSAIRRTGSKNFWNLPLPKETKYYVPRLLAVAAIIKNPEKYGVKLPPVDNKPYFKEVKVSKPVNLKQMAKSSGISIETLHKLNPDYTKGSHPRREARTFLIPA